MSVKAGTYSINASTGKLCVYTFKEGMLSKIAHDLLIEVTDFNVQLNIPEAGIASASVHVEAKADSLKVFCAMKDGQQQPDTLKEKDLSDIEEATSKDVLHPAKYPDIKFRSTSIQEKENGCHITGDLALHGVTRPIEFDALITPEKRIQGKVTLQQKDFGIKPYKALLGTLKVKNEVNVAFDFPLNQG